MKKAEEIKQVRQITGAGMKDIKCYWDMFPKATIEDMIDILKYVGLAVYHKIPVEIKFQHLK